MSTANTSPKRTAPNTASRILKVGSEWRTAVEGSPPKYAAKKMPMKTAPTPSMPSRNVFSFLLLKCIQGHIHRSVALNVLGA